MTKPLTVTDSTFDADVLKSDTPVLVDFGPPGADRAARSPRSSKNWQANTPAK